MRGSTEDVVAASEDLIAVVPPPQWRPGDVTQVPARTFVDIFMPPIVGAKGAAGFPLILLVFFAPKAAQKETPLNGGNSSAPPIALRKAGEHFLFLLPADTSARCYRRL